jgi:2OG-Fe(II) oxygenase superfamily
METDRTLPLMDGTNGDGSDGNDEVDSLFDSASPTLDNFNDLPSAGEAFPDLSSPELDIPMAQRTKPTIPGLFFDPSVLISEELAASLTVHASRYFGTSSGSQVSTVNQVMFFGRASEKDSGLPPFLDELIHILSSLLQPHLPMHTHRILFPPEILWSSPASRQAILNHYIPGEGITPHVDLLTRFADGIVAVSLGGGTVMTFRRVVDGGSASELEGDRWDVYLPARSILVLTEDARYKWTHGIEGRLTDCVAAKGDPSWIQRETRISITLRWLLPGADIVGG